MRYQSAIYALALSITSTSAQSIDDIPSCASAAAIQSLGSTSCAITDLKCICQSSAWIQTLIPEVSKACSAADLEKTRTVTVGLCKNVGVDLVLPPGTTDTMPPATATSATKSAASPTSAAVVSAAKSGASSAVASPASSASGAVATVAITGSATALGPQSGLLGMMGIAMGMIVL